MVGFAGSADSKPDDIGGGEYESLALPFPVNCRPISRTFMLLRMLVLALPRRFG